MRFVPIVVGLLYPALSLASGGDVLLLLWLEAALLVAVILSVVLSRLPWVLRVLLFAAYVAAVLVPWFATQNMPYTANYILINVLCIGVPASVFFGGLFIAMHWRRT